MTGAQSVIAVFLAVSVGLLVLHFVLYPALLWIIRLFVRRQSVRGTGGPATVSIVIAAHNEAPVIARRLKNALSQTSGEFELILVSDGSSDGTAEIAKSFDDPRLTVIELDKRRGKAHALNEGAAAASGDIIVFSDANAIFADDAIEKLLPAFADPGVGIASGAIATRGEQGATAQAIGAAEGAYWRYESFIRNLESDIASTVSVVGPLLAIRRTALEPLPEGTVNDDAYRALSALKAGWRVVYVPAARCWRQPSPDHRQERERRSRIAAGRYQQLAQPRLWPINQPVVLVFWLVHKVLRLSAPFLMAAALTSDILLVIFWPQTTVAAILLAMQAAFYVLGMIGMLAPRGSRIWRLPATIASFLGVMAGNLAGFCRFLAGSQSVLWVKAKR